MEAHGRIYVQTNSYMPVKNVTSLVLFRAFFEMVIKRFNPAEKQDPRKSP